MKTRLISIGSSRGVRLPKTIIAQAGLTEEVKLEVRNGAIIITRATSVCSGWAEATSKMHRRNEDRLLDAPPVMIELINAVHLVFKIISKGIRYPGTPG